MAETPKIGSGSVEIELAGQTYTMKPCFAAFSQINLEIPGGIIGALKAIGSFDINAMESVVAAGCQFLPERRKSIGDDIFKAGTRKIMPKLQDYLVMLNNGGEPVSKDKVPEKNDTKDA